MITAIVLLSVSFSTLEPTEYGLAINGNTQEIDPEVKSGGRWFLGLGCASKALKRRRRCLSHLLHS